MKPEQEDLEGVLIGKVRKNASEEIVIRRRRYNGFELIDIRVFTAKGIGTYKGISFSVRLGPELANLIHTAAQVEKAPC